MQNYGFAGLRVWWSSVIVFLFHSQSLAFMLWQRNSPSVAMLKHAASFSTQQSTFSIRTIRFRICRYESGQFGKKPFCFCLRSVNPLKVDTLNRKPIECYYFEIITSPHYGRTMIFDHAFLPCQLVLRMIWSTWNYDFIQKPSKLRLRWN